MLIWNAEDPAIKTVIEPFGYTSEKLDEGKSLFAEVETLAENQRVEYAEQYNATSLFVEKRQEAEDKINAMRKFTKFALRNIPEANNILKFSKALPRAFSDWQLAVKYFYERLQEHPDWITLLSPFGITAENITQNLADIEVLKTLQESQQRETGDAQRATLARNAKFDDLHVWYSDLRELARILFEDADAQYLEKLGITVKS